MSEAYHITFSEKVNVDPVLSKQTSRQILRAFLKRVLPGHEQLVLETIQRTPAYLEMDLGIGYRPYVASQHTLSSPTGDIAVGVMSEMTCREGKRCSWHTSVTTVDELKKWIAAKQDLLH